MPIYHEWNGTVLTITSDSGTSSADLRGSKGDDGIRGPQGAPGGTCFEVQQVAANLLDNSYFPSAFVINQRGETTYTGSGYSIDRWRAYHADAIQTITAAGLTVGGSTPNIYQIIEPHKIDTNKVYTAAAMDSEGNIYIKAAKPTTTGYANVSLYINENSGFLFRLNGGRTWVWAALYEGEYNEESLPKYHYKGYAAELLECQRYCIALGGIFRYRTVQIAGSFVDFPIVTPIQLRVRPTFDSSKLTIYKLENGRLQTTTDFTFAIVQEMATGFVIRATKASHDLTDGVLGITAGTVFSADL